MLYESTDSTRKNIALDGLRGLAAIAVVFAHCAHAFFPYLHTGDPKELKYPWEGLLFNSPFYFTYAGGFAVSLFFVLSGYVLSKRYFKNYDSTYLLSSACKRYVRLGLPVFAAVMLSYLLIVTKSFSSVPQDVFPSFAWAAYRGSHCPGSALSEGIYGALVYGHAKYDYVLWTIQIEFVGSFFLFAFLALFGKSKYLVWIVGVTLLILLPTHPNHGEFFASPVPGTYISMFLVGALINKCKNIYRRQGIATLALLLGLFISSFKSNVPMYVYFVQLSSFIESFLNLQWDWAVLFEMIAAWILITAVIEHKVATRLLSTKPIAWAGKVSFSVYLIHTLILGSLGATLFKRLEHYFSYEASALLTILAVFVCTMAFSELFRRAFDSPAINLANYLGKLSIR